MIVHVRVYFVVLVLATSCGSDDWLHPDLPSTLIPLHYDLWMHPEFYDRSAVFHGTVDIDLEVVRSTRTIIVHYKALNVTSTTLTDQHGYNIPVSLT